MKKESKKGTGPRYAREKPAECSQCFFWIDKKRRCTLGGNSNCYYLMEAPPKKPMPINMVLIMPLPETPQRCLPGTTYSLKPEIMML